MTALVPVLLHAALGLLLAGPSAPGAAAQVPPGPVGRGRPKPLESCATVTVSSGECKAKSRRGKVILKDPVVMVASEFGAYSMFPKQFAKDYKKSFDEGPGADLSFLDYNAAGLADAGSTSAIFVLASVKFKKKKNEMSFTVFPQVALADLITGTGECEVTFDTACVAPPPPEPLACEPYSDEARTPGGLCVARYAGGADGTVSWLGEPRGLLCNAQTGGHLLAVDRLDGRIWALRDLDGDGKISPSTSEAVVLVQQDGEWMRLAAPCSVAL